MRSKKKVKRIVLGVGLVEKHSPYVLIGAQGVWLDIALEAKGLIGKKIRLIAELIYEKES